MTKESMPDQVSLVPETVDSLDSNGTNFFLWRKNLDFILRDRNIAYVLTNPKSPIPSTDGEDSNEDENDDESSIETIDEKWDDDDSSCRRIIFNSINKDLSIMYQDCPTAKSLLDALTDHFKPTIAHCIALYRDYFSHRMADDCPISQHIAHMGALAAELEAAGVQLSEKMKAIVLTESLPKSLKDVVFTDGLLASTDLDEKLTTDVVNKRLRAASDMGDLGEKKGEKKGILDIGSNTVVMGAAMLAGSMMLLRLIDRIHFRVDFMLD